MIAENALVHREQPASFSNEKNDPNLISILTTHLRDIGRVSHGNVEPDISSTELVLLNLSDRDAPVYEVGSAGLVLFCLLYGGTKRMH